MGDFFYQYFNIVYFPNQEWHPTWYGETLFHGNDATTGDYTGRYQSDQKRNFPIGDVENVVEPMLTLFRNILSIC